MPSGVDQINHPLLSKIDKELRLQATEWAEYKTPEGKCYYYNTKSQQSVWEKPEVLIKLERKSFSKILFNFLNIYISYIYYTQRQLKKLNKMRQV